MLLTCVLSFGLMIVALAISSCGSTSKRDSPSNSHPTASGTLSQSELVAKAEVICQRLNANVASAGNADFARIAPKLASYERQAADELNSLVPPASLAPTWSRIVTYTRKLADNTVKFGAFAKSHNTSQARQLFVANEQLHHEMIVTAANIGFKDCQNGRLS